MKPEKSSTVYVLAAIVVGWVVSAAVGYIRCRQDAFQRYCDQHFFDSDKIEWLDFHKDDGAL